MREYTRPPPPTNFIGFFHSHPPLPPQQTTRGTGADVIIVDEAAHIDPALFFKVIVPILQMKNTSLMCLSSPEGDSNYFSGLLNLKKDDGKPFFHVIDCFQICKACQKLERVKQINCNHIPSTTPWLAPRKQRELKQLYKASPEDAIREFGGMVVSDYKPALPKEEITRLFGREAIMTQGSPPYIFTTCDPNGGGPSQMSIVSVYFAGAGGQLAVIVGMDSEAVRDDRDEYMLLHRHYFRLREHPLLRQAKQIFIPENNLGLESAHLDAMVKDIPGVRTYWEKPNKPGVCKDGRVTRAYQFNLAYALAQQSLAFDYDCFTVTKEQTVASMKLQLQDQMLRYHWEKKPAADAMGKDRYALTGKVGNKQDDLLIALAMAIYWPPIIMQTLDKVQ